MMVIDAAARMKMDARFSCRLRKGILGVEIVDIARMNGSILDFVKLVKDIFLGFAKSWKGRGKVDHFRRVLG
jgi:hypothetical protein